MSELDRSTIRGMCYTALLRRINNGQVAVTPEGIDFPIAEIVNSLELPEDNAASFQRCHQKLDRKLNDQWAKKEAQQNGHQHPEGYYYGEADEDPVLADAIRFVVLERRTSISALQRQFQLGYNRAARLMEYMEEKEIVTRMDATGQRTVLKEFSESLIKEYS